MYCLIQFYVQLRTALSEHSPFLKVLAIKLVIFLSFWQSAAISVGTSTLNIVRPNQVIAYPDLKVGIPSLLLCFEMAIFAILHLWAFPYRPYLAAAKPTFYPSPDPALGLPPRENEHAPRSQGGFWGFAALWDALNLWDVAKAFGRGVRWLFVGVKHRHQDVSYHSTSRKDSAADESVDMADLDLAGKRRNKGGSANAAAGLGAGRPGARSTDHLPIANEFRRSRYGVLTGYGGAGAGAGAGGGGGGVGGGVEEGVTIGPGGIGGVGEEHAGLIAHAQPEPHSPAGGVGLAVSPGRRRGGDNPYDYDYDGGDGDDYHGARRQQQRQQQQDYAYPPAAAPYGGVASLSTVEEEEPYDRSGAYGGGGGNPRNSTQIKVGAALWGARPPQEGGPR